MEDYCIKHRDIINERIKMTRFKINNKSLSHKLMTYFISEEELNISLETYVRVNFLVGEPIWGITSRLYKINLCI